MVKWLVAVPLAAVLLAAVVTVPAEAATRPNTTITAGPSGLVSSRAAEFRFRSSEPNSSFQCRMDSGEWSSCSSPKKYTKLGQGEHTFRVRARKNGLADRSPAVRSFVVDTRAPQTTILTDVLEGNSVMYTFEASEPATFSCRLDGAPFEACTSPFTTGELADEVYTFEVRARDAAGNVDQTPAASTFEILTPLSLDQETADAAAAYLFPDSVDLDVTPTCAGTPAIECPGGIPKAPSDQLRITSTRSVVEVPAANRYDVAATSTIQTLDPVVVTFSGVDCDLTITSAAGAHPTWGISLPLNFVTDGVTGELRIEPGDPSIVNAETADLSLSGENFLCALADFSVALARDVIIDSLLAQVAGQALCAASGPDLLGPCPE
jgi:hypothetical protein